MIRLFIAIAIPESIKKELAGLGRSIPEARPVPVEQMHLTLKFFGEVEGSRLLDIKGALSEISRPQFTLCLHGVGTFPPRGTPRVLWAGVQQADNLLALRQAIEKKLVEINIPREKQKYSPHLTLARLNNSPLQHLQQFLAGNAFLRSPEFSVAAFNLYKSQLTRNGAIHSLIETYALKPVIGAG
ncbi:MAG: RNA 2',3'-cyclic phosphodiesterase [Proteobacteria bacterium]|nr:RNA 2',3'-cyclic phosphodiesterase [Pseudomonadota bacterium]